MEAVIRRILFLAVILFIYGGSAFASVVVDGGWLKPRLDDPDLILIDMSSDPTQYQRFHIPGAVHIPYKYLTATRRDGVSVRAGDRQLKQILGYLGITPESQIVIYDDMGGLEAGRLFWELERIGHENLALLDGGLVKWILDGKRVVARESEPRSKAYPGALGEVRANVADIEQVQAALKDGKTRLLDVRSREEYAGDRRAKRSGHIPGAGWWPWEESVRFDQGFVLKEEAQLRESLTALGLEDPETPVILYCRTGHRASQSYYVLRRLGYRDVKIYDGSMAEWSRTTLPLKEGMEP
ncbi:MAG: sulfurtransferase [Candidatus Sedimenticola endophacoides]